MKKFTNLISCIALLLTTACAQAGLFAANAPTHFSNITALRDVSYGPLSQQKLDIYSPPITKGEKLDVVIFFYGGRWESGNKEQYRFVGTSLAQRGFIVVIPDYRKYSDVKFPAFIQDGAKAVAWVSNNIEKYNGNPDRINVAGHSAGAHIGALIATDKKYLANEGKDRSKIIKSFVGLAGPYDFTPDEKDLVDMFGPPARYPDMRPTTFADSHTPPMLLLHGADDKTVGLFNLEHLQDKIEKNGGCVKSKIYPGVDHIWIVAALSWLGKSKAPVLDDMTEFFKKPGC